VDGHTCGHPMENSSPSECADQACRYRIVGVTNSTTSPFFELQLASPAQHRPVQSDPPGLNPDDPRPPPWRGSSPVWTYRALSGRAAVGVAPLSGRSSGRDRVDGARLGPRCSCGGEGAGRRDRRLRPKRRDLTRLSASASPWLGEGQGRDGTSRSPDVDLSQAWARGGELFGGL
jgi:hypothetical protein